MNGKILIVDDSANNRTSIKNLLSDYIILIACDGLQAIEQIENNGDIDLVIIDEDLFKIDGLYILNRLKADDIYNKTRVIILSNHDEIESEIEGLKLGVADYITKPFHIKSLKARIEVHLEIIRIQRFCEEKLNESSSTLETIIEQAPIGIVISYSYQPFDSNDYDVPIINKKFEEITGRTKEELMNLGWSGITHPDDLQKDIENYRRMQAGEIEGYSLEKRYIKPNGNIVWANIVVARLKLNDCSKFNHISLVQDITTRKKIETELFDSERSKAVLLDNIPGMMYRCSYDKEWTMQYVSNGCLELTGYSPESLLFNRDLSFNALIKPEYHEYLWRKWDVAIKNHVKLKEEYEIITSSGEIKWVWEQGQGIYDEDGNVICLEGLIIDINDRKNNEIKLKYLSERDPLTGLSNLRTFEETYLTYNKTNNIFKSAIIMLNVSTFSTISSTMGFRYGQELLKDISECLLHLSSEVYLLFHISLDHFAFYITKYKERQELSDFCEKLIQELDAKIYQKTTNFNIGVIEIDNSNIGDAESVLKKAYLASEKISNSYRFSCCFFSKEMEEKLQRDVAIIQALTKTIYEQHDTSLFMLYQPIISMKTNEIVGFEALARYKDESIGFVSPAEFIPIAEASQLILPLGKKIMRLVFCFASILKQKGYESILMSFNVSAIQLLSETFLTDLVDLVEETGVDPRNLNVEITESVFSDNYHEINERLDKIKMMGMKIAIDDFGTGYSSLARERELNVNCLKIDKYFIDKLTRISPEDAITGDIISMAHKLGHYVVAEGVEYEVQREYLLEHDCDMMQGYLFSRPVDQETAIDMLKNCKKDML